MRSTSWLASGKQRRCCAVEVVRVVVGVVAAGEAVVGGVIVGEAVVGGVVVVVRQVQALEIFCERSVLAAG